MAAGLPVVASAVSGIPELLADGVNARLVAPARVDLLANVLAELLADSEQRARLSAAGRHFVREECSWPRAVRPLEDLLRDVLASPVEEDHQLIPAASTAQ
jgi:glycosyltransferase involved in cell wall biosynthesis